MSFYLLKTTANVISIADTENPEQCNGFKPEKYKKKDEVKGSSCNAK